MIRNGWKAWMQSFSPLFYIYHREYPNERHDWHIYIPLCFYLYISLRKHRPAIRKFTFHYVSTYTTWRFASSWETCTFTFHYVSTYTIFVSLSPVSVVWFTFHYVSTYTSLFLCSVVRFIIYIPLCFYLYALLLQVFQRCLWFTFHYVSTYTPNVLYSPQWYSYLHSTMFLLIPE